MTRLVTLIRSRVARRMLLLFLLSALLPIGVLSFATYGLVDEILRQQSRERLLDGARSVSAALVGRLEVLSLQLARVEPYVLEQGSLAGMAKRLERDPAPFRELTLVDPDGRVYGRPREAPAFPAAGPAPSTELRAARIRVLPGPPPRLLLVRELRGYRGPRIVAALDAEELFAAIDDVVPATQGFAVVDSEGVVIYEERGLLDALTVRGLRELSQARRRIVVEGAEGGSWSLLARPLFLAGSTSAAPWTVVYAEGASAGTHSLSTILQLLPGVVAMTIAVVLLLSLVSIRRQLEPLGTLRAALVRIGRGETPRELDVKTGDEFEELADAVTRLGRSIESSRRVIATRAEIDRSILASYDEGDILETVLVQTPSLLSGASVGFLATDTEPARLVIVRKTEGGQALATLAVNAATADRVARAADQASAVPPHCWPRSSLEALDGDAAAYRALRVEGSSGLHGFLMAAFGQAAAAGSGEEVLRATADQLAVALTNARLVADLKESRWQTLEALARTIDASSPWTHGHSLRVTEIALEIGRSLGLGEEELDRLHRGGLLHDIGKIAVPKEILDKPGRLSAEELETMREHPTTGVRILQPIEAFHDVLPIVRAHHERFAGGGYPDGVAGERIPLGARILAVADVYDALSSDRPYRPSWSTERVVAFLEDKRGSDFDPRVVDAFLAILGVAAGAEGRTAEVSG